MSHCTTTKNPIIPSFQHHIYDMLLIKMLQFLKIHLNNITNEYWNSYMFLSTDVPCWWIKRHLCELPPMSGKITARQIERLIMLLNNTLFHHSLLQTLHQFNKIKTILLASYMSMDLCTKIMPKKLIVAVISEK